MACHCQPASSSTSSVLSRRAARALTTGVCVRLVAIGAVHIAQALCPMAAALDLDASVIDPRTAFATPGANLARAIANARSARSCPA